MSNPLFVVTLSDIVGLMLLALIVIIGLPVYGYFWWTKRKRKKYRAGGGEALSEYLKSVEIARDALARRSKKET